MIKEASLLVGGAAVMALFLTPEAQTTELESGSRGQTAPAVPKKTSNVILDEDAYWEYDDEDSEDFVFGQPMVDADSGAVDHSKTMVKKVPEKAARASGRTSSNQKYPKPMV
jgi:hypothetical protein